MSSILVPLFTGIVSNFGFLNYFIFVIQMTKNILILEGDNVSIKKKYKFLHYKVLSKIKYS